MLAQFALQLRQQLSHPPRQAIPRILQRHLDQSAGRRDAMARLDQAKLAQQAADLVDQRRSCPDQPASDPMQGLAGLLLGTFHLDVAHVRSAGRLANRLRVIGVVLATFDVGFDELRRDQPHFVAQRSQLTRPVVRATAGLHGNQARLELAEEVEHLRALELFAADRLLMAVDAVNLEHLLCQIDADSLKFHGDSLLR
ncbi:hypothetical protein D3C78_1240870 [compost metagenome]